MRVQLLQASNRLQREMARNPKQQIQHFLKTGHSDVLPQGWPGENWLVAAQNADRAMRQALIEEVKKRSDRLSLPQAPLRDYQAEVDPIDWAKKLGS
ncbi:MAG: hypothetical protein HY711_09395 [Candidatus Melainabacteria bacterium]|nr:hypothetical protein [Candidatus Melainabacteria bacterium]